MSIYRIQMVLMASPLLLGTTIPAHPAEQHYAGNGS